MRRIMYCVPIILFAFLFGCEGKTKEDLVLEGQQYSGQGNYRGAIVLYKNALEKDPNYLEARFLLGEAYLESGKYNSAEKEYQKLIRLDPSNTDAILKLALIRIKTRKADQAIELIEEAFSKTPQNVKALELLGQAYAVAGDLKTSENLFREGIRIDPKDVFVRLGLARVLAGQEKVDEARSLLSEVLVLDSENSAAFYFLAELEASEKNIDQAIAHYESLLRLNNENLQALFRIGLLSLFNDNRAKAQEMAQAIMEVAPESAEGLRLTGLIAYLDGDYESASISLLSSLSVKPHPNSYFFLGLSYYALEQYEQALNQFQKVLDIDPAFVKARNLTALTLLSQGRIDDAITECRRALSIEPSNAFSYYVLGSAHIELGSFDEGMAALDQAIRLNPELAGAHLKKGIIRMVQGELKLGEEDLVRALKAAPEIQNTRLLLASHYLGQENYTAAIKTLTDGLTGKPVDGLLYNVLAGIYLKQKKPDEALSALDKAKSISPDYFTPYFNLARYYSSIGEYENAKREYRSVLSRKPGQTRALLSLASLAGFLGETDNVDKYLQQARETGAEEAIHAFARYRIKQGQPEAAIKVIDEGLKQHPDSISLLELKARLSSRFGDSENAEIALRRLASLSPERGASYLASFYLGRGETAKAQKVAEERIGSRPESAAGYLLLSSVQIAQEDYSNALNTIDRGVSTVKDKFRLEMQRGTLYERRGNAEKAETVYKKITDQLPDYIPALFARAAIYHRQGEMRRAQGLYEQIIQQSPDYVPALNNLAYLLADNFGRSESALQMALKAYQLSPFEPYIMDTFGYLLTVNGKPDEALSVLRDAVKLAPQNPTINLHLAMALVQQGQAKSAQPYLQFVLEKGQPIEVEKAKVMMEN